MRRVSKITLAIGGLVAMLALAPASAQDRDMPYWASITADRANMRTGPGRNFPISWLYQRRGLPVRVVEIYENWRKVEDPDGTQGWMLVNLLSSDRTAMITGGIRPLREQPEEGARIRFRAEPGVVGRINNCRRGWCQFDVRGRIGYVQTAHLYGVTDEERVE